MKKIIGMILILMIGLVAVVGCSSSTVEPNDQQQQDTDAVPENSQQNTDDSQIPAPPALPEE